MAVLIATALASDNPERAIMALLSACEISAADVYDALGWPDEECNWHRIMDKLAEYDLPYPHPGERNPNRNQVIQRVAAKIARGNKLRD